MKQFYSACLLTCFVAGCASADPSAAGSEDLGSNESPFLAFKEVLGSHIYLPGSTTHGDITKNGLFFLEEDVAEELADRNEETDTGSTEKASPYHNDNCQLQQTSDSVRERYDDVIK